MWNFVEKNGPTKQEEPSPSKVEVAAQAKDHAGKPVPMSLQNVLQPHPPVGDFYVPYTAILGFQRKKPKLIWRYFTAIRQDFSRISESYVAMQKKGQAFERKVYQPLGYGANRTAFAREGSDTAQVQPLAARIHDCGKIQVNVGNLVVQQKMGGPLAEEYWSYIVAVVSAVSARRLSVADLGQSNLAVEVGAAAWPKLRFLDLGSWHELKAEEAASWPSRDSQLWTFMSGHLESSKVATLKSIAHGFKSIHEVHTSVRSVLSEAPKEDGCWL